METKVAPRSAAPATGAGPRRRQLAVWAVAWAAVGCVVGLGIAAVTDLDPGPALRISVLFAEVVGFTAFVSARMVFPLFVHLPYALSLVLQVLTLMAGTVLGSIFVVLSYPLLSLREYRIVAAIVLANALIAVVTGIALYTYDTMCRQIEASYLTLRENEAMERELSFAREVQIQLLPGAPPEVRGLELAGACIPASGVGGDYYDFLRLSEDEVGLVIADVAGKGISGALLMAGLQAAVRSLMRPGADLVELTCAVNRLVQTASPSARYATLFLGVYDTPSRTLRYSNAGHLPPLVLRGDSALRLGAGGIPVGMFPHSQYTAASTRLSVGDVVALYTDGITEAPGVGGAEFGAERLLESVRRQSHRPLAGMLDGVLGEVRSWSGGDEARDDVTLVLARVR